MLPYWHPWVPDLSDVAASEIEGKLADRVQGEAQAKVALLTHLRASGALSHGAAIISELVVGQRSNRVDLALANGRLRAFEIKSSADTLARLPAQVAAFRPVFHELTIVAATRHVAQVAEQVPPDVGIAELVDQAGRVQVRHVRRATPQQKLSAEAIVKVMPVTHLVEVLRALNVKARGARRATLESLAVELPLSTLVCAFRRFLKERYGASSQRFQQAISGREVKPTDLAYLKAWASEPTQRGFDEEHLSAEWDRQVFEALRPAFGPVPSDILTRLAA